jgi:hypothetical protein
MTRQHRTAACLTSDHDASESWSLGKLQSMWLNEWASLSWSDDTDFSQSWTWNIDICYSWAQLPFDVGCRFSAHRDSTTDLPHDPAALELLF